MVGRLARIVVAHITQEVLMTPFRPPSELALLRYQAISAYVSLDPPLGQRAVILNQLAAKTWSLPDGQQVQLAAETLRTWVRRFRRGGLRPNIWPPS